MNMRRIIGNILFVYTCVLTVSCGKNNIDTTLDHAENIVEHQPDSALILLDSIKNPIKTPEQQVLYSLLSIYARDLNDEDISTDERIIHVIEYLQKINKSKYRALAEYYMGRVYQAQGNLEQAIIFYMKAWISAEKSDDNNIKGLIRTYIGKSYYEKSEFDDAVNNFKAALKYFDRNYEKAIPVNIMIGNVFLRDRERKNKDSVFMYYDKALQLAESHRDALQQANVRQNLGVVCLVMGKPDNAMKQLYQAVELNPELRSKVYFNLSQVYEQKKMIDSAGYFAELSLNLLLEKKNDPLLLSNNYKFLSKLEERKGNYSKALDYLHKHNECEKINHNKKEFNPYEVERKHNQKLIGVYRNKVRIYVCAISGLFVSILTMFAYFLKKKKKLLNTQSELDKVIANIKKLSNKNETLKTENEKLEIKNAENEKQTNITMEESQYIRTKNEELRQSLSECENNLNRMFAENKKITTWIFQLYDKVSLLIYDTSVGNTTLKKTPLNIEKLSAIIFQKDKWNNNNHPFHTLFKNVMEQVSEYELSELELQIVCLSCIGFNSIKIAAVLRLNKNTVQKDQSNIKKKLGLNSNTKIKDFILDIDNNTP